MIKKVIEKDMFYGARAESFALALQMRKNPTEAENVMWKLLRKFRRQGFPFRRQHPIEFYIADFYCHNLKLVIEVDGGIHSDEKIKNHDEGRTGELERFGIKVIRFTNEEVLNETNRIYEEIDTIVKELAYKFDKFAPTPLHPPLTPGEGEQGGEAL